MSEAQPRLARRLRLAARLIGAIIAFFFLAFLVGETVQSIIEGGFQNLDPEGLFAAVPAIFLVGAFIVAWWRERLGGILLIVAYFVQSFAPTIHAAFYRQSFHIFSHMFLFALPFLVAGILFLIASRLSRQSTR